MGGGLVWFLLEFCSAVCLSFAWWFASIHRRSQFATSRKLILRLSKAHFVSRAQPTRETQMRENSNFEDHYPTATDLNSKTRKTQKSNQLRNYRKRASQGIPQKVRFLSSPLQNPGFPRVFRISGQLLWSSVAPMQLGAWRLRRCISRRAPKIESFFELRESLKYWGVVCPGFIPTHAGGGGRIRTTCLLRS